MNGVYFERQQQQKQNSPQQKPPEPSEKAKEALARALQLVQQRRYDDAKAVLEQILAEDPTAAIGLRGMTESFAAKTLEAGLGGEPGAEVPRRRVGRPFQRRGGTPAGPGRAALHLHLCLFNTADFGSSEAGGASRLLAKAFFRAGTSGCIGDGHLPGLF